MLLVTAAYGLDAVGFVTRCLSTSWPAKPAGTGRPCRNGPVRRGRGSRSAAGRLRGQASGWHTGLAGIRDQDRGGGDPR
ncbi:hypothetical protein DSL92_03875 [Billgrantia gudaonensis]|uniref:Uncharacterized protein n=1 Tax=Billgrantia gudaonensis TaxID=376427 RepID=A0A432JJJ4_9GAMM|nr:hypothetical protein DSL92_03875 [Halomonas gudaonensis]